MDLVTLEGVEILQTGMEYPASTGPFTVTATMLEECVASQDDPHILSPRIKLGHSENPLDEELQELFTTWREDDSNPSIGTVQNMVLSEDGQVLLGDLVGIPQWLADILASAYPARSIEGGAWQNDANGKEYAFTISALALLGVAWPGCTSLDDLQELFSEDGPAVTVIEMERGDPMTVKAQANVQDIQRHFYNDFAQGDRFWWWIHEMLIDPNELIVEDEDEGQLYRLPYTVGDGTAEFGEPTAVKVEYVPDARSQDAEARVALAFLPNAGKVLASFKSQSESRPADRTRPKEVTSMTASELRESLGLAEDASDEDVLKTVKELKGEKEPDTPDTPDQTGNEGDVKTPSGDDVPEEQTADEPAGVAAKGVTVDKDAFAQLQSDAAAGVQARKVQLTADRKTLLEAAVKAGKFPPASVKGYQEQLDKGGQIEAATREFIESLPDNTIPVEARGEGGGAESLSTSDYPSEWLSPSERAAVGAASAGAPVTPTITKEA